MFRSRVLLSSALLVVVAAVAAGCGQQPSGWWPPGPEQRDGLVIELIVDDSCDEAPVPSGQLTSLLNAVVTEAAWHQGELGLATLRNNAPANLSFTYFRFQSKISSGALAISRDLQRQRNDVSIPSLIQIIKRGRRGPCRTDIVAALGAVQSELGSLALGDRPVAVVLISNGVLVARGFDFCSPQASPSAAVAQFAAASDVPLLSGVRLVFVGLGRANCVGLAKLHWLEQFWADFAKAAKAKPIEIREVPALISLLGGPSS